MRFMFSKQPSLATLLGALGAALMVVACVTVGPTATSGPSFSLAPGATPTVPPTLAPGVTLAPITLPPVTAPPVTQPPIVEPTPVNPGWPIGAIAGRDAGEHIGETLTVCGRVASTNWVYTLAGHPTWLNYGQPYPNQRFNAVIWGEQRRAWPLNNKPEVMYLDKIVCVHGLIQLYKTWPQIQDLTMADFQVIP